MTPFKIRIHTASLLRRIFTRRFLKFGTVGASGTVVNLGILYVGQEHLFRTVEPTQLKLNLSLALAIFLATVNNFFWNRLWTWADRQHLHHKALPAQFWQYTASCGVSILLQVLFTNLLAPHFYYQIANLIAIAVTSVVNFLLNDIWTFGRLKLLHRGEPPHRD
jgi:dolichol-phosphate mannosyltransferase